jgi:hypothetical protein
MMDGLTQEDPSLIGFVLACYVRNTIGNEDLVKWAEHVISTREIYPPYLIDLLYFDEPRFHVCRVIGFVPHYVVSRKENLAIYGITYLRKRTHLDGPDRELALAELKKAEDIRGRFRDVFPFIELPD